jgi:hypothetical protein
MTMGGRQALPPGGRRALPALQRKGQRDVPAVRYRRADSKEADTRHRSRPSVLEMGPRASFGGHDWGLTRGGLVASPASALDNRCGARSPLLKWTSNLPIRRRGRPRHLTGSTVNVDEPGERPSSVGFPATDDGPRSGDRGPFMPARTHCSARSKRPRNVHWRYYRCPARMSARRVGCKRTSAYQVDR